MREQNASFPSCRPLALASQARAHPSGVSSMCPRIAASGLRQLSRVLKYFCPSTDFRLMPMILRLPPISETEKGDDAIKARMTVNQVGRRYSKRSHPCGARGLSQTTYLVVTCYPIAGCQFNQELRGTHARLHWTVLCREVGWAVGSKEFHFHCRCPQLSMSLVLNFSIIAALGLARDDNVATVASMLISPLMVCYRSDPIFPFRHRVFLLICFPTFFYI